MEADEAAGAGAVRGDPGDVAVPGLGGEVVRRAVPVRRQAAQAGRGPRARRPAQRSVVRQPVVRQAIRYQVDTDVHEPASHQLHRLLDRGERDGVLAGAQGSDGPEAGRVHCAPRARAQVLQPGGQQVAGRGPRSVPHIVRHVHRPVRRVHRAAREG